MKFSLLLGLLLIATNSYAVYEDFSLDNSDINNSQYIGDLDENGDIHLFGARGEVSVFGVTIIDNDNADFYSFDASAGNGISINVFTPEGPEEFNDTILGLFDVNGNEIATSDYDHVAFDEYGYDPKIIYNITETGTYFFALAGWGDDLYTGDIATDGESTDFLYTVEVSNIPFTAPEVSNVPVPAAVWLFGTALVGVAGLGRRRTV